MVAIMAVWLMIVRRMSALVLASPSSSRPLSALVLRYLMILIMSLKMAS